MKNEKWYFKSSQIWKKCTKNIDIQSNVDFCNVGYIQCYNPKYDFFSFNGVGKYAYNFLLSHIEISWHLSWRNQVRKGLSLTHPNFLDGLNHESKGEDNGRRRSWVRSLTHNTLGVEGHARASGWD
jgi:hypothetical protein